MRRELSSGRPLKAKQERATSQTDCEGEKETVGATEYIKGIPFLFI